MYYPLIVCNKTTRQRAIGNINEKIVMIIASSRKEAQELAWQLDVQYKWTGGFCHLLTKKEAINDYPDLLNWPMYKSKSDKRFYLDQMKPVSRENLFMEKA